MAAAEATTVLGDADFPADWGDTVPDYAFKNRDDLKKVELPSRIKKIGRFAFLDCLNLEECKVPPGVEVCTGAFDGCLKLKAMTVLGDADFPTEWNDTIPEGAFISRIDLWKVKIPPKFKKIGHNAFYDCPNLEICVLPPGIEVGVCVFEECWKLRGTTILGDADFPIEWGDTIPDHEFVNRLDIVKVDLPPRIKKIGRQAFDDCLNLEEFVVQPGVEVGFWSFHGCDKLRGTTVLGDAYFPEEWGDTIPASAFEHRLDLKKVELPPRIKNIEDNAFYGCSNLEECVFPPGVKVGFWSFNGCDKLQVKTVLSDEYFPEEWGDTIPDCAFEDRFDVYKVIIPSRIKKIGKCAFYRCSNLEECIVPPGVKVGFWSFYKCDKLQAKTVLSDEDFPDEWGDSIPDEAFSNRLDVVKVEFPPRIKNIGELAFSGCANLVECVVPPGVEKIESSGFLGCTSITVLLLPPTTHTIASEPYDQDKDTGGGAFEDCSDLQILALPAGLRCIGSHAFNKKSLANLKMLVVPPSLPSGVVADVVAMVSPRTEQRYSWSEPKHFPGLLTVQMVGPETPDSVVAALQGPFAEFATMAAVPRSRIVSSSLEYWYWSTKTHEHGICTPEQRACALATLLVGARLVISNDVNSGVCDSGELLPALPNEIWIMILGWLRRDELGR